MSVHNTVAIEIDELNVLEVDSLVRTYDTGNPNEPTWEETQLIIKIDNVVLILCPDASDELYRKMEEYRVKQAGT